MDYQEGKSLADRFFDNRCSPEEAEKVLEWLETPDGQKYLGAKMETDFDNLEDDISKATDFDQEILFERILNKIDRFGHFYRNRFSLFSPSLQIAAGLLILMVASLQYIMQNEPEAPIYESEEILFVTAADEQREIRLGDGTRVRMNSNSVLKVSSDYMREIRAVYLEGEAFFEVENNPEQVFTILSEYARIEVLGTSFNVRTDLISTSTQVAVSEGRVSVQMTHANNGKDIIIDKGEYAYLNYKKGEIIKESSGADNYLSWLNNRLEFNETTLENLCKFISRAYEKECHFGSNEIKELKISATFTNSEIGYVLEAIAITMNLKYSLENDSIRWKINKSDF